jgi:predicted transcriptional regulator
MKETMTVTLDKGIKDKLKKQAERERRPLSWVCNEIFINFFENDKGGSNEQSNTNI